MYNNFLKTFLYSHSGLPRSGKMSEKWKFSRSGKSQGSLVWVRENRQKLKKSGNGQGISKFSQNWDGYGSLLNFQKLINLQNCLHSFVKWFLNSQNFFGSQIVWQECYTLNFKLCLKRRLEDVASLASRAWPSIHLCYLQMYLEIYFNFACNYLCALLICWMCCKLSQWSKFASPEALLLAFWVNVLALI